MTIELSDKQLVTFFKSEVVRLTDKKQKLKDKLNQDLISIDKEIIESKRQMKEVKENLKK